MLFKFVFEKVKLFKSHVDVGSSDTAHLILHCHNMYWDIDMGCTKFYPYCAIKIEKSTRKDALVFRQGED